MPITVTYPYTFVDGTTIEAAQVNANFNAINSLGFANAARAGANTDITSISGLTTPLSVAQGGTGSTTGGGIAVPTGSVQAFAGGAAPTGWLTCAGQAVSRTTYAALFAVIGTAWGAGDGATTFNLPDFRGRTLAGYDAGNATGRLTGAYSGGANAANAYSSGGEQGHALATAELASHNHGVLDPGHLHTVAAHTHVINDPGHVHGPSSIYDPGHTHQVNDPGHHHTLYGSNAPSGVGGIAQNSTGTSTDASHDTTSVSTGIYLNAAATGLQLSNTASATTGVGTAGTALTSNGALTGVATNPAGSSAAHNTVQPTSIILWIIKD